MVHADIAAGLGRRGPWGERRDEGDGDGRHAAGPRGNHGRHRRSGLRHENPPLPEECATTAGIGLNRFHCYGRSRRRPRLAAARKAAALEASRPVRNLRHGTPGVESDAHNRDGP